MVHQLKLLFYTRPGCHLCDVALEALRPLQRRYPVDVEIRNVEDRVEWEELYGEQIPVGLLEDLPDGLSDGRQIFKKIFKFRVDAAALETAISARLADAAGP